MLGVMNAEYQYQESVVKLQPPVQVPIYRKLLKSKKNSRKELAFYVVLIKVAEDQKTGVQT